MPVFLAGENVGRILSKSLKIPMKRFSHQEGHIGACLLENSAAEKFLSIHLSGGTTETVLTHNTKDNLLTEVVGGSLDISMGQLIDRIGVHLGLNFPCGLELEGMSRQGKLINLKARPEIRDGWINLSGHENLFKGLLDDGSHLREDVIYTLFHTLGGIIAELIKYEKRKQQVDRFYLVGGVSANSIIRGRLNEGELEVCFPSKGLSTDNAVGIAYLAACKKGWED
jgi:N6-L-threonylcarbamoyladenine synthase